MNRQLGQLRPAALTAASIVSSDSPWRVDSIIVTNTGPTAATFTVYHDADGSTYSTATAIAYNILVNVGAVYQLEFQNGLWNTNRLGNLAIQASKVDTLTFTVYGEIQGERI